jgi:hypothetical protein
VTIEDFLGGLLKLLRPEAVALVREQRSVVVQVRREIDHAAAGTTDCP